MKIDQVLNIKKIRTFFRLPKNQVIIILVLLLITSTQRLGINSVLPLFLLCVTSTVASDILFAYKKIKEVVLPRSAIVTGLILTLIIDPQASWYQILIVCASAMAIKNFVRPERKHIFNPASSGLLMGWLFFVLNPSWWAPSPYSSNLISLENIAIYIPIFLLGYVSCYRLRRYKSILSYLVVYTVLTVIFNTPTSFLSLFFTIISPGTLFYLFLMLVEPMTSPVNAKKQILYGGVVASITVLLIYILRSTQFSFFDPSLTALLLGNLFFFKYK